MRFLPRSIRWPAERDVGHILTSQPQRADEHSVRQWQPGAAQDLALAFATTAGLLHQNGIPLRLGRADDVIGELREVGLVQLGYSEPDHAAASHAEIASREVRSIAD